MRMSCNGCRVLRKGCSEDCTLKPCLEWIKSPESQSNATLFLAKFYGRAGLINLINAGPSHLRSTIFSSLLYEACGRIINPIYGSVGLMSSGNWDQCQAAVEAVLRGSSPTTQPLPGCDIRHLNKDPAATLHRVRTIRQRFKRSGARNHVESVASELITESDPKFTITGWDYSYDEDYKDFVEELNRAPSQDSVETVEPTLVNRDEDLVKPVNHQNLIELELTLGLNPVRRQTYVSRVIEISNES